MYLLIGFLMSEPVFMKLGLYNSAPELIQNGLLLKTFQSVCVSVCVSRQRLDIHSLSQSQSQSYITTDSQSVSKSWCRAHSGTFDQRSFFFFLKFTVLSFGGALSDER
jgi:hypothetical protein